ncbi:hypothetical protein [Altererythrobacter lutimaris]|uniref:Uncharacterized protein n=1 Tax=Altererythrobacter lutimaris TaxID=2743979 RepID=A0A850H369_9SPHN|nr:hypothetical protein [Altererythrobacter lutimaris]NVE93594.1 hypothetical protein [Altererythrobacter lutimaris]
MEARTAQAPRSRSHSAAAAKRAHGILAGFILIFIVVHFATHFAALGGAQAHAAALDLARPVYQFPLVEIALVMALATQIVLGIRLLTLIRKRVRKGLWHKVQFASGAYLAFFIILHTSAAVITRLFVGLDTNFYWAAGTVVLAPLKYGFTPYYVLAVTAIASHLLAAMHFRRPRPWQVPALAIGPLLGITFVFGYGGAFQPVELPQEYRDYLATFPGVAS